MSIRLRLTLLYSTILLLTLVIFGVALYSIQAQETYDSLANDLRTNKDRLARTVEKALWDTTPPSDGEVAPPPMQPQSFLDFSADPGLRELPEREIVRILGEDGALIASPFGREEDALPLSEEGLAALQNGEEWLETGMVSEEKMLIYSFPVSREGEIVFFVQTARSLTERDRTLKLLATTLAAAGGLMVLAAFGIGWVLSGLTLRPIHRITQTAQTIGEERDFSRRVVYQGPQDEVSRLANTFNQMLSGLQQAYQKVEHSLEMQRDFVADVSHELRTPLTTLRGNLGLLGRKPPMPDEEQSDILADMVDESDRLIRLVNDLLAMARADAGRALAKEPVTVQPVVDEVVRQMQQLEPDREIRQSEPSEAIIQGDQDALKQIVLILIDNAFKHSEGEVEVEVASDIEQVTLSVQDHGAGISAENLERVFDRFWRPEGSGAAPGFGLGLPIAKTLVEGMGGTIRLESEPGKGSRVVVTLPGEGDTN
jgi:two-component system OmpR family sensor kinase